MLDWISTLFSFLTPISALRDQLALRAEQLKISEAKTADLQARNAELQQHVQKLEQQLEECRDTNKKLAKTIEDLRAQPPAPVVREYDPFDY